MPDAGYPVEIDITSAEVNIYQNGKGNYRYLLGYIQGEFPEIKNEGDLYISVYFKRNTGMQWEGITYQLNREEKIFKQKLPNGLLVHTFYLRLYGWITDELEITSLKCSIKEIAIGKFSGESLVLMQEDLEPEPPQKTVNYVPFEIYIFQVGNVTANTATAVWATTHKATSRVTYGLTPEEMTDEEYNDEYELYHTIILKNLNMEEPYYCRTYSTSELTGEEICSETVMFFTGKEITIQSIISNSEKEILIKLIQNIELINTLRGQEALYTTEPDRECETINYSSMSIHQRIEISRTNIIGNETDYSVTP